jgi:hypothetical protein
MSVETLAKIRSNPNQDSPIRLVEFYHLWNLAKESQELLDKHFLAKATAAQLDKALLDPEHLEYWKLQHEGYTYTCNFLSPRKTQSFIDQYYDDPTKEIQISFRISKKFRIYAALVSPYDVTSAQKANYKIRSIDPDTPLHY